MKKRSVKSLALTSVVAVAVMLVLIPFFWMITTSFMKSGESFSYPPRFWPKAFTIQQYQILFQRLHFLRDFLNSFAVASLMTVSSLFINSLAGFAFAKYNFKARRFMFTSFLVTMVIPGQVGMLPVFLILRQMGMLNTYWGLILPGTVSAFSIFFFRQYMSTIPTDLIDSARIDGCGDFKIYWRIMLPLARPALVTLGLFTFLGTWNDFMWPLIVMNKDSMYTLPVALANLMGEHAPDTELMMAGSVVTTLPVMILFLALQKSYVSGLVAGSLKE
ncbi:MAG: carbohydrate ABC transporter permease [Bacteroidetes bacterium]|nr:carbohydrate ABC transporter permease [Bacteroidota bacterium]